MFTNLYKAVVHPVLFAMFFISKNPGTGTVVADDKQMPGITIMLEDLGKFMVEQITSTQWIKKAPLVASK